MSKLPKATEMLMISSQAVDADKELEDLVHVPLGFALFLARYFFTKHSIFPFGVVMLTLPLCIGNE